MLRNILVCPKTGKASVYDKLLRRNRIFDELPKDKLQEYKKNEYDVFKAADHPKSLGLPYFAKYYSNKYEFDEDKTLANLEELNEKYPVLGITHNRVRVQSERIGLKEIDYGFMEFDINLERPSSIPVYGGLFRFNGERSKVHPHIYYSKARHPTHTSVCIGDYSVAVTNAIKKNFDLVEHMNIVHEMLQKSDWDYSFRPYVKRCSVCDEIIRGQYLIGKKQIKCEECK